MLYSTRVTIHGHDIIKSLGQQATVPACVSANIPGQRAPANPVGSGVDEGHLSFSHCPVIGIVIIIIGPDTVTAATEFVDNLYETSNILKDRLLWYGHLPHFFPSRRIKPLRPPVEHSS